MSCRAVSVVVNCLWGRATAGSLAHCRPTAQRTVVARRCGWRNPHDPATLQGASQLELAGRCWWGCGFGPPRTRWCGPRPRPYRCRTDGLPVGPMASWGGVLVSSMCSFDAPCSHWCGSRPRPHRLRTGRLPVGPVASWSGVLVSSTYSSDTLHLSPPPAAGRCGRLRVRPFHA